MMVFPCCYCSSFVGTTFKKLLNHIRFIHSHEPNFIIKCGDCGQSFQRFNSFKSHIQRKHKDNNIDNIAEPPDHEEEDLENVVDDVDEEQIDEDDEEEEPKNFIEEMTRFLALFVLKTKEENRLSQRAVDAVLDGTEELVESSLDHLKEQISTCLERNGIEVSDVDGLNDVLQQPSVFTRAKQPLRNEYQQVQYFKDNFNFVDYGVTFRVEGLDTQFRGSIGPFSSDNLGAHSIGGYTENFNGLRICRFCMGTSGDIQTMFTEDQFQLRTRAGHNRHCQLVQRDPSMASAYGVKRSSILNQSRYFHVVDGLDVDIMHDQLEGVLPLEIKMLLKQYTTVDKFFTLDVLNERIATFNYAAVDVSNKPSPIKPHALTTDTASLSQSASQMWCLARMLPLLIGDFIPVDDECWDNFLRLLKIEEIVFAPQASTQLAAFLQVLVEEYLDGFKELYDRRMIPKQHYMVHYPRQMIRRGPLVRHWAMRFEAKHNYFKRLVDTINNFKDIVYSLARRHQALQAYLLQSTAGNFLRMSLEIGPGRKTTVFGFDDQLQQVDPMISGDSTLTIASWAKVYGTKYSKGCVIIVGLHHGVPNFGEVHRVLIVDGFLVVFEYKMIQVTEYVSHLNAYKVAQGHEMAYVKQTDLQDFHPVGLTKGYGCNSNLYVVLKYRVDFSQ